MAFKISLTTRNAMVNTWSGLFSATSKINIYSNSTSQPASPETSAGAAVLLAQVNFAATAFQTSTTGTGIATGLPLSTVIFGNGTAGWFRFINGASASLADGTITTTAVGTGDLLFDNTTFISGGTLNITDLSLTVPQ